VKTATSISGPPYHVTYQVVVSNSSTSPVTLDFLRERSLVHVIVDAPPEVTNRVHTIWEATHPQLAMVRLHGRNTQTWSATGAASAADRFDYDYSDDELTGLAPSIRAIATRAGRLLRT